MKEFVPEAGEGRASCKGLQDGPGAPGENLRHFLLRVSYSAVSRVEGVRGGGLCGVRTTTIGTFMRCTALT